MMLIAFCAISSLDEPTNTVPSSSISIEQRVSSIIDRITRPPGPITRPIFSCGIWIRYIRGAYGESSARGVGIASSILFRMNSRASRACASAFSMMSEVNPPILMSIWSAVIPSAVPATLKSMSP